ncbi:MAG: alcohol dehydrogenase catalytic domain-containing protein [Christensenella sp.]|nr:alcohol dehydrogenase catalytic domain-containing protein [Christensenella sp.]
MKTKMKAQLFVEPERMEMVEMDIPEISEKEVLIKVEACGICGSDISYYYGFSPLDTADGKGPLVLGHEVAGEIVAMGDYVKSKGTLKIGDRVALNPVQPCNACNYCRKAQFNLCKDCRVVGTSVNGGFAEYTKIEYTNVFKLKDNVSFAAGALTEPLACAMYGMKNLDVQLGDVVVIIGSGTIGLMMTQIAKARGAGKIILVGVVDWQLEKGLELGANCIINTLNVASAYYTPNIKKSILALTDGMMADRVIVPTNAVSAINSAVDLGGGHATIVFFGLPGTNDKLEVPLLSAIQSDKIIKFSWLTPLVWPSTIATLNAGLVDVDALITQKFTLEEAAEGIEFMYRSKENKIKGVVVL